MNSMFGGAPPQGGMFGGQQQGPLMQLLASNPQLMQMLLAGGQAPQPGGFMPGIEGEGLSPDPYAQTRPEQWMPAGPGNVPGTADQNIIGMVPPQTANAGAFGGIPPEIMRMLFAPR